MRNEISEQQMELGGEKQSGLKTRGLCFDPSTACRKRRSTSVGVTE